MISGSDAVLHKGSNEVLVTWMRFDTDDAATGGRLRQAGLSIRLAPKTGARSTGDVGALVRDAVAAIVSTDPFDDTVFRAAPHLQVLSRVGVGVDTIDLEAATRAGVVVTTTPGLNAGTAGDHTLALMLAAVRRIVEHDDSVRRGEWQRGGRLTPWDLHGATVGIVGYGAIGRAVARRLAGFDVQVLVTDIAVTEAEDCELVPLDELLRRSDVITLHLPLTWENRSLVSAREFALIKPGAILVNTARGGLVDEHELVRALSGGRLRAAALDVFADEPEIPKALRAFPNVVLTPHVAGLSEGSIAAMMRQATANVLDVLGGKPDPAVVANPTVLELRRVGPDGVVHPPDLRGRLNRHDNGSTKGALTPNVCEHQS